MSIRINEKLDELVKLHDELVEDLPNKKEFLSTRILRRGIEKTIQLIADGVIDVSMMIISEKGLEKPMDSRGAITVLQKNKILSKSLAGKIKDLISFRNLLVHLYGKIDENEEYQNIKENHEDILKFVEAVEKVIQ